MEERRPRDGGEPVKRALPLVLLLAGGCVYYNGMYNANRLANRARKAERNGQTFAAQGFWAQAQVRADTVIARYPTSSWADDAQLIVGEAMMSRGDCAGAIPALEQATLSRDSPKVAEQAQVRLGACQVQVGNLAAADRAFVALMESSDTSVRNLARVQHARILRLDGAYQAALDALEGLTGPVAVSERTICYAALGEVTEARPLLDQALARNDTTLPWGVALAGIGRVDPGLASQYTTAVAAMPGLPGETRDDLLVADGLRLAPTDPDSALARLRAAAAAKPVTEASLRARLRISDQIIGQADTLAQLELARPDVAPLAEFGGPSAISAINYLRVLDRARGYLDSVPPGAPQGDLATFVLAESVRDVLPAPRIAAQLFAAVPALWPTSPYAPKALLALAAMREDEVESIVETLWSTYPDSPYVLLVAGEVTPAVLALEDSLLAYSTGGGAAGRTPAVRRAPAAGQRQQDDLK